MCNKNEGLINRIRNVFYFINKCFIIQPDGIFSDRLAPDTLVLDCKLSDRNHLPSDVVDIFDPPKSGIHLNRILLYFLLYFKAYLVSS